MKQKDSSGEPKGEDLRLPPVFSRSFYDLLAKYAEEFAVTRSEFAIRALKAYAKQLRKQGSALTDAIGEDAARKYGEVQSKLTKKWWSSISPEQRAARTKKANEARWPKKKPQD